MLTTALLAIALAQATPAKPAEAVPAAIMTPSPAKPAADTPPELALTIGSKAPIPEIDTFVRGEKPAFFEPGKVYVLEFWATWCGPCRQGMPHLTKVAEEMRDKGVVVVGISDEPVATVTKFLEKDEWKQKARYTLCTDPDRSTQRAYMEAAAQNGIPTAFIVKEGTVQWIGHPMEMDEPLARIVAGTWDPKAAKQTFEDAMAEELRTMGKRNALAKAMASKDWDTALRLMDEEVAAAPASERSMLEAQKVAVLLRAGRGAEAYALVDRLAKADPKVRPWLAMVIMRTEEVADRRPDVAIDLLEALIKEDPKQPQFLAEVANAYAAKKDWPRAIEHLKAAMEAAKAWGPSGADYVAELAETLKGYEADALRGADGRTGAATPPPAK